MNLALRHLLPAAVFILALVLLLAFSGAETISAQRRAERQMTEHANVVGNIIASGIETSMRLGGIERARVPFEQTRGDRRLEASVVVDADNQIIFASRLAHRGKTLSMTSLADLQPLLDTARKTLAADLRIAQDGNSVLSAFPVRFPATGDAFVSHRIGAVLMRHSLGREKSAVLASALWQVLASGTVLALFCALVWLVLDRTLVRPLNQLVDAAGNLAQGQRAEVSSLPFAAREIDRLTAAFNDMSAALASRTQALEDSQAFLFATMDALPSQVAVLNDQGRIIAVNEAWRTFADRNGLELPAHGVGASYLEYCTGIGGADAGEGHAVARALREMQAGKRDEFQIDYYCTTDNEDAWFALEMRRFDAQGARRILLAHHNVTTLKQAEQALRLGEERYRALYDQNPSMFLTVSSDGTIESVNSFGAGHLGYGAQELIGTPLVDLHEEPVRESVTSHLAACMRSPGTVDRWEAAMLRRDGRTLWARQTARSISTPTGKPAVLLVCEDVSETQKLSERLEYQASHDSLTGLINRHEFENRLGAAVDSALAGEAEHVLCYVDLDQFKVVNDTCGHIAGDELMRQIALVVADVVRKQDTLARLGGDEFGILMQHCPLNQGVARAESVREAVESFRFVWEGKLFSLGASIGVVQVDQLSGSATQVLSAADAACYISKDDGRNRVTVSNTSNADTVRRHGEMQWVSRIQHAIDNNSFELYYQKIVSAARRPDDEGLRYELLIRMRDEEGQIIPPGAFLPAAERFALASRIDRWVVSTATRWLAGHPAHLEELDLCSINVSGQSLAEDGFLDFVLGCIEADRVPASKLGFEITETAAISDLTRATRFISALSDAGCRFALDDFGAGLSSFAYLKQMQVNALKIDGLFVRDIVSDPIDHAMVKSINDLGHVMGKQTVAEFVENDEIADALHALGVDYLQGYGIHRPEPIGELEAEVVRA